jgi:serine/threonine-protein kinase
VRGKTLKERIPRGGLDDPRRAVRLVTQVARALHHVWSQHHILHRDVKPSNIMLAGSDDESLYLLDFGLAACRDVDSEQSTLDGTLLGTPAYMAPEQTQCVQNAVTHASDLYSAGVVLFQLLTGKVPFPATSVGVLTQIRTQQPPLPSSLRPGLDPALDALVLRALAKKPQDRFATGKAFADALEQWLLRARTRSSGTRYDPTHEPAADLSAPSTLTPSQAVQQGRIAAGNLLSPSTLTPSEMADQTPLPAYSPPQEGQPTIDFPPAGPPSSTTLPPPLPPRRDGSRKWARVGLWAVLLAVVCLALGLGVRYFITSEQPAIKGEKSKWWGNEEGKE